MGSSPATQHPCQDIWSPAPGPGAGRVRPTCTQRTVITGAQSTVTLEQAVALRRQLDQELDRRRIELPRAAAEQRQSREVVRNHRAYAKAQQRAMVEQATQRLAEVRQQVRAGEQLWRRTTTRAGDRPWQLLEQYELLTFVPTPPSELNGAGLRRIFGAALTSRTDYGWWVSTADRPVRWQGSRDRCPALAQWGENTRTVLRPWLVSAHREQDQLVARYGLRARSNRPIPDPPRLVLTSSRPR